LNGTISISNVVKSARCPVRLYLERNSSWEEPPAYTICKQISYHLGNTLDKKEIWREVTGVCPQITEDLHPFFDSCVDACSRTTWRTHTAADLAVSSVAHRIFGVIDRVFDDEPRFSVVRSVQAPSAGVFRADRVRIVCYTLCLEELLGTEVDGGSIEYIPAGISRFCHPQPRDRRQFMSALRDARKVMSGEVPKRPLHASCSSCPHEEFCTSGAKRLSDLL
jgi:CRISPR-associated exonuclease Cas4